MTITTTMITLKPIIKSNFLQIKTHNYTYHNYNTIPVTKAQFQLNNTQALKQAHFHQLLNEFDPQIPIEKAFTPPSSWYTDPSFYHFELQNVFYKGWQAVGFTDQIKSPRDFFTGRLGNVEFVICRDEDGKVRGFHNVCRHHGSVLVSGCGKRSCFVCPYHAWTYGLDGALLKATRITGMQNFSLDEFGLIPLNVATWGPFVLLNVDRENLPEQEVDSKMAQNEWLGNCSELLKTNGIDSSLSYVCRRTYSIECNWKVFVDNYLDGGYHVPFAHKGLSSGLDLNSYTTTIYEKASVQRCKSDTAVSTDNFDRLGFTAFYAFIYPNFMINRYGPWMDTNLVLPLGPSKCEVIFDYFIETEYKSDETFIERSLVDSERVQMEDIKLCEGVQRGLESPAYCRGRYVPTVEIAMHHFHQMLHSNLKIFCN